jgi:protein-tyrosine-phosphatase
MAQSLAEIDLLFLDREGVGRANIAKAMVTQSLPGITVNSAGVLEPDSKRKDMHPEITSLVQRRLNIDISDWKVQLLKPEMISAATVVLVLCDPGLLPDYVTKQALDVLLAPIHDPFENFESKLENTATTIALINWLLCLTLKQKPAEIGTNRDNRGMVIPRHLTVFEPPGIDPEYSLKRLLSYDRLPVSSSDPKPFLPPLYLIP